MASTWTDTKKNTPPASPPNGVITGRSTSTSTSESGRQTAVLSEDAPTSCGTNESVSIGIPQPQPQPQPIRSAAQQQVEEADDDDANDNDNDNSSNNKSQATSIPRDDMIDDDDLSDANILFAGGGVKLKNDQNIDDDIDRLMGITHTTNNNNTNNNNNNEDQDQDQENNAKNRKTISSLEMAINQNQPHCSTKPTTFPRFKGCCKKSTIPVGNSHILNEKVYRRLGICIIGPTWPGCLFTVALLYCSSIYFVRKAYDDVGVGTALTCVMFTISATLSLFFVSCRDPGIVRNQDDDCGADGGDGYRGVMNGEEEGWRWCDFCSVYQPPTAAHCPECNVCIEGYDHHCPWMGTCIGKGNFKPFIMFNFSWIFYLIYAMIWVNALGPIVYPKHDD